MKVLYDLIRSCVTQNDPLEYRLIAEKIEMELDKIETLFCDIKRVELEICLKSVL